MPRRKAYGAAISPGAVKQFGRPLHETQRYQSRGSRMRRIRAARRGAAQCKRGLDA